MNKIINMLAVLGLSISTTFGGMILDNLTVQTNLNVNGAVRVEAGIVALGAGAGADAILLGDPTLGTNVGIAADGLDYRGINIMQWSNVSGYRLRTNWIAEADFNIYGSSTVSNDLTVNGTLYGNGAGITNISLAERALQYNDGSGNVFAYPNFGGDTTEIPVGWFDWSSITGLIITGDYAAVTFTLGAPGTNNINRPITILNSTTQVVTIATGTTVLAKGNVVMRDMYDNVTLKGYSATKWIFVGADIDYQK